MGRPPAHAAGPDGPVAPKLVHIAARGFFLDLGATIALTSDQKTKLTALKESADQAFAARQREIDAAENELWALTAVDQPDLGKIEAKITEIERSKAKQRLDYVRAAASAVAVLEHAQHQAILASAPAATAAAPSAAMPMGAPCAKPPCMPAAATSMPMGDDDMAPTPPAATGAPMAPMPAPGGAPAAPMGHM